MLATDADPADAGSRAGDTLAPADPGPRQELLGPRALWRVVVVLTLLPLVISGVTMAITVGNGYHPWGDWAGMEMFVRDVGHHPVLVGLYSRDNWSHPGPVLFYLLAIPYRLSGDSSIGMHLGALLINGASILGMAAIARRRGGTPLLLSTLLGCALLMRTLGPHFVRDPWVCYVTVLPFGLMVLLAWSMTCGETWALPVGAGVASYLAQTHIGYVPLALPLLAWGGLGLLWRAVQAQRGSGDTTTREPGGPTVASVVRASVVSGVVILVLWLPPIIDELFHYHSPGNFSKIVDWFQKGKVHTLHEGYRVVAGEFGWPPEWMTRARRPGSLGVSSFLESSPLPVLLVPLVVAGFVLWRRRGASGALLVATIGVGLGTGVLSVARTVGVIYDYRLRWTWILGMLGLVAVAWALWLLASRASRWLVPAAVSGLAVLSITNSVSAARARIDPVQRAASTTLARFEPQVLRALPDRPGDVIIRATSPGAGYYKSGLVLRLERDGIAARVDANPGDFYGKSRDHHRATAVRAIFTVAINDEIADLAAQATGARLIGYRSDQPRSERARLLRERAVAAARLNALHQSGKIDDDEYLRRTVALPDPGLAVGLFEIPVGR